MSKKKKRKENKKEKKRKERKRKKNENKKRIEELWSLKESTLMCLLSYVIPSYLTIIKIV